MAEYISPSPPPAFCQSSTASLTYHSPNAILSYPHLANQTQSLLCLNYKNLIVQRLELEEDTERCYHTQNRNIKRNCLPAPGC
jgi:hypothetical protein